MVVFHPAKSKIVIQCNANALFSSSLLSTGCLDLAVEKTKNYM